MLKGQKKYTKSRARPNMKTSSPGDSMPPAPGLYTCIKSWKILYKIRLQTVQTDFFETCNKWVKWWGFSVDITIVFPGGYVHILNHEKNCIKSDFNGFLWNLQQTTKWQDVPVGIKMSSPRVVSPCPRAIYMYKIIKKCIKSDFKEIFFKLVANDRSDKRFLFTSKFCPLGLSSPDLRLYTLIKSWKDMYKVRDWRDSF